MVRSYVYFKYWYGSRCYVPYYLLSMPCSRMCVWLPRPIKDVVKQKNNSTVCFVDIWEQWLSTPVNIFQRLSCWFLTQAHSTDTLLTTWLVTGTEIISFWFLQSFTFSLLEQHKKGVKKDPTTPLIWKSECILPCLVWCIGINLWSSSCATFVCFSGRNVQQDIKV